MLSERRLPLALLAVDHDRSDRLRRAGIGRGGCAFARSLEATIIGMMAIIDGHARLIAELTKVADRISRRMVDKDA